MFFKYLQFPKVSTIVYCATRGERQQFHECEVSCPNEARADITRVKLLPRPELRIQFFITPQVEIRLEMPRVLKEIPGESPMGSRGEKTTSKELK